MDASLPRNISHIFTTPLTPLQWVSATGSLQAVLLQDMPWRLGEWLRSHFLYSSLKLMFPYRCHLGKTILHDTITKLKWSADIRTHSIRVIVDKLLAEDWDNGDGNEGETKAVPEPKAEDDCTVRFLLM